MTRSLELIECERLVHFHSENRSDLLDARISGCRWISSFANFSRRPQSFFYSHNSVRSTQSSDFAYVNKCVSNVPRLRYDVRDFCLLALFSSVSFQSPAKLYGKSFHDFLFLRRKQQKATAGLRINQSLRLKQPRVLSDDKLRHFLIQSGQLFGASKTPEFSTLFPSTSFPRVTMVLGNPRISKEIFNSLLLSLVRSSKASMKQAGLLVPLRLPRLIILELSRMIDRSLRLELVKRTTRKEKLTGDSKKKSASSRPRVIEFVPAVTHDNGPETTNVILDSIPEDSTPAPPPHSTPDNTTSVSTYLVSDTSPAIGSAPWIEFTNSTNSIKYASPEDLLRIQVAHRKLVRTEYLSGPYRQSLGDEYMAVFREFGIPLALRLSTPTSHNVGSLIDFLMSWYSFLSTGFFLNDDSDIFVKFQPVPNLDALHPTALSGFYRDQEPPEWLDSLMITLETLVMEIRSW